MRLFLAEFLGTALLLAVVVGSGIMAERLAVGNAALALLANSTATGLGLAVLIVAFVDVSGSHFNPIVTLVCWWSDELPAQHVTGYIVAQFAGAIAGVALAQVMFELPLFSLSDHVRSGVGQWVSEAVATFGLVFLVSATRERHRDALPYLVGAYIAAAYWFTASTSFANPAVTVARTLTNTFTGIRPQDALMFIVAQMAGAIIAVVASRVIYGSRTAA